MFTLKQRSELISILSMLIAVDSVRGLAAQSAKKNVKCRCIDHPTIITDDTTQDFYVS